MAQAVRERTSELAVLKTIGSPATACWRWCWPNLLLVLIGGALGLGLRR